MKTQYSLQPIGIIHSPYKEKFGTPRQPGLVYAQCSIELLPPYNQIEALKGLEGFSHIWVSFIFHQAIRDQWQPTVRPPRLGGNEKVGVFATYKQSQEQGEYGISLDSYNIRWSVNHLSVTVRQVSED